MITPRSRRIRASSQLRLQNEKFFHLGKTLVRSKSKQFKQKDVLGHHNTEGSTTPMGRFSQKPPYSGGSINKTKSKNTKSSNDIITANTSKLNSNFQSDKKRKDNVGLNSVREEEKHPVIPQKDELEIKQLDFERPPHKLNKAGTMKNNFICFTEGGYNVNQNLPETIRTVELQPITSEIDNFSKTNPRPSSQNPSNLKEITKDLGEQASSGKDIKGNTQILNKEISLSKKIYPKDLNENFEITSTGMMRLKHKPQYMNQRYKDKHG